MGKVLMLKVTEILQYENNLIKRKKNDIYVLWRNGYELLGLFRFEVLLRLQYGDYKKNLKDFVRL